MELKKKNPTLPFIRMGRDRSLANVQALRRMIEAAPDEAGERIVEAIASGDLTWASIQAGGVHLRDLYALNYRADGSPLPIQVQQFNPHTSSFVATDSLMFPVLVSNLNVQLLNQRYSEVMSGMIGDQLVESFVDSKKVSVVSQLLHTDSDVDEVREGEDYPLVGPTEEFVTIGHKPNGRRIQITQQMIEENDIPGLIARINALPRIAAYARETQILARVTDKFGSKTTASEPYAYHLNGSGTTLYTTTANNPTTRAPSGTRINNTPLVGPESVESARAHHRTYTDDLGKRIGTPASEMLLLVPDNRLDRAWRIVNSELTPGVEGETNMFGPKGPFRFNVISSPLLDDIDTTAWYLGAFKRQFRLKEKLQLEAVSVNQDPRQYLLNRLAFEARMAWDFEVGAVDHVYVVQCLEGSTYNPS